MQDDTGSAAIDTLSKLAVAADIPQLRELFRLAVAAGNDGIYEQCNLVNGLAKVADIDRLRA